MKLKDLEAKYDVHVKLSAYAYVRVCVSLWARVSFLVYQKKFSIFLAFTSNQERDLINTSQVSNPPKHTHTHPHTYIYTHTK